MGAFSEESMLLAKNWDTVQDILNAEKRLRKELSQFLLSIENELTKNRWWDEGWEFILHQESQVYISNKTWQCNEQFLVWIGVEGFNLQNIFGVESSPNLYVWVTGGHRELAQRLTDAIKEDEHTGLGKFDQRDNCYVVKQALRSLLLEGDAEKFTETVKKQIIDFFVHYAILLRKYDGLIKSYCEGAGKEIDSVRT